MDEVEGPYIEWDPTKVFEDALASLKEDPDNEGKSLQELEKIAYNDPFPCEMAWEDMVGVLTMWIREFDIEHWIAHVYGFGWLKLNGHKVFRATDGLTLLREVLPQTDCTFKIYKTEHGFRITNYHHDAPTGETYEILPDDGEED